MFKQMLQALGLCFALTTFSNAQTITNDTVSITPLQGSRILLVGRQMKTLLRENNFELLKNQFIADMKVSAKDNDFPASPMEVIYLVAADGRRRLKTKPQELVSFDTQKEMREFSDGLPPFHYTIYDLGKQFEYHLYLKNAEQLYQLADINFKTIMDAIEAKEKKPNAYTKIEVEGDNKDWQVNPVKIKKAVLLELSTSYGIALFNSSLSPVLGVHGDITFHNKYRMPQYKIGTSFSLYAFSELHDFQFKNIYGATSTDIRVMKNIAPPQNRAAWLGFLIGRIRSGAELVSAQKPSLTNRLKFGIAAETGLIGIEYGFIIPKNNQSSLTNLTFRFRF